MVDEQPEFLTVIPEWPKRLYAVGDIHGCVEELETLGNHLKDKQRLQSDDLVIFIGDYIDRGPSSKQVVDYLLQFKADFPATQFLKGNHEEMLLSYLGVSGSGADVYLDNGGTQCFRSYGLFPFIDGATALEKLPPDHLEFYKGLKLGIEVAEFIFVHAGLDPAKSLTEQTEHDLLWIRSGFTAASHPFGKTVVFGHTPFAEVVVDLPYKIGIDTGLVFGNKLSCVELVQGGLYQVERGEQTVIESSMTDLLDTSDPKA